MNSETSLTASPDAPTVVGFEMPGSGGGESTASPQVMTALLDVAPSRLWKASFHDLQQQFMADHSISDLRLVAQTISIVAATSVLRSLTGDVKALVYRTARTAMQKRIAGYVDSSDDEVGAPASTAVDDEALRGDIARVTRIAGIPALLEAVTHATGMRFAAVARVTDTRWTACAVYDNLEFGLVPGQDLVLESTICNEIRQHGKIVTFDHASSHPEFSRHPVPTMYGFESYISVPIYRGNGDFFGTLCALDPEPSRLDEATIETLEMFTRMIGIELDAGEPMSAQDKPGAATSLAT